MELLQFVIQSLCFVFVCTRMKMSCRFLKKKKTFLSLWDVCRGLKYWDCKTMIWTFLKFVFISSYVLMDYGGFGSRLRYFRWKSFVFLCFYVNFWSNSVLKLPSLDHFCLKLPILDDFSLELPFFKKFSKKFFTKRQFFIQILMIFINLPFDFHIFATKLWLLEFVQMKISRKIWE